MITWRGLATSGLLHALAIGMVLAGVPQQKREVVEDIPSIAVELLLEIESSPLASQSASDGAEEAEADTAPLEPVEPAERDMAPEPVDQAVIDALLPSPAATTEAPLPGRVPLDTRTRDQPPAPVERALVVASLPPVPAVPEELMVKHAVTDLELRDRPPAPERKAEVRPPQPAAKPANPAPAKTPKASRNTKPERTKSKAKVTKSTGKTKPAQRAALASGKGSTGKTRTTDGSASDSSFKSKVLARLRAAKRYPDAARSKGMEGVAVLSFTINASGQLLAARIVKGSGHSLLDKATLAMARSAAPFPKIPPNLGRGQMTFRVPVQFKVD